MDHLFTVSELNSQIKSLLEHQFPSISLEGEVSNFKASANGHWYFTLKDNNAMIQAVMFKHKNRFVTDTIKDGMQLEVKGNLSVYEQRGNYQIICQSIKAGGIGAILQMLEERKNRLQAEGLFNPETKQALPFFPKSVAVITSPTGAAIRDILQVLRRRNSGINVTVVPVAVQGEESAKQLEKAIRYVNTWNLSEVIILGRGGGSLEDLLSFSDEELCRTIYKSQIPVISAVGHEIDWALSDYVADLRAPTPSAAAELVSQARDSLFEKVMNLGHQIASSFMQRFRTIKQLLTQFKIENFEREFRMILQPRYQRLDDAKETLIRDFTTLVENRKQRVLLSKEIIDSVSPEKIFKRGYAAIKQAGKTEKFIKSAKELEAQDDILINFAEDWAEAAITTLGEGKKWLDSKKNSNG
jgi:exodeoxyribonuclease VII large subunit